MLRRSESQNTWNDHYTMDERQKSKFLRSHCTSICCVQNVTLAAVFASLCLLCVYGILWFGWGQFIETDLALEFKECTVMCSRRCSGRIKLWEVGGLWHACLTCFEDLVTHVCYNAVTHGELYQRSSHLFKVAVTFNIWFSWNLYVGRLTEYWGKLCVDEFLYTFFTVYML